MVVGSPHRIQQEVLELLEKIPCQKVGKNPNKILEMLALFCLDCPKEFKEWHEKWQKKQLKK